MWVQQSFPNPAVEHFRIVVEPAALEFLEPKHLGSVRHGYQAAIMLAHMAEYFFEAGLAKSSACHAGAYLKQLAKSDADLEFLADVRDASKHAALRPEVKGAIDIRRDRAPTGSKHIGVSACPANSSEPANSSLPANLGAMLRVTFDRGPRAGTRRPLHPAVRNILSYWRRQLGLPDQ